MEYKDPAMFCKKCHAEIPRNGVMYGVTYKMPRLACEYCARDAGPPAKEKQKRLRKGEPAEGQETFLGKVPTIQV